MVSTQEACAIPGIDPGFIQLGISVLLALSPQLMTVSYSLPGVLGVLTSGTFEDTEVCQ